MKTKLYKQKDLKHKQNCIILALVINVRWCVQTIGEIKLKQRYKVFYSKKYWILKVCKIFSIPMYLFSSSALSLNLIWNVISNSDFILAIAFTVSVEIV